MKLTILLIGLLAGLTGLALAQGDWQLPEEPPPEQYGNVLINRLSELKMVKPVLFSHWSHRTKYTCRVCHFELEFEMKANATEITEDACRNGQFCGACHDGKTAFGHTKENCHRCHNGGNDPTLKERFKKLRKRLPKAPYGNGIDWDRAYRRRRIRPKKSIYDETYRPMRFRKLLRLEAEWSMVPPAYFPHSVHNRWLDCAQCHPDIFNIKKKTTKHFEMKYNLQGKFCGVCHLKVAFPMRDCKRCHPAMKNNLF
ncbi:MAG: hypothetical protein D6778_00545 [Nitrospirae bacterium]|nr:MAG: hypothetical protein D6778_00545 [Nitrospirota bacterium]